MTKKEPKDLAASVRQRLLNHARETGQDFQIVLAQYAFERLLYRLGQLPGAQDFTLKGALLFLVWTGEQYRPTHDLDLMSRNTRTEQELKAIFTDVCIRDVTDDGLVFLTDTVTVESIRDADEYGGMRVTLTAQLERARIPVQIDVGFAEAITPQPIESSFPVLLDFPAPSIAMYPPETSIAEKFHTVTVRGILNSRMKDYYDIWTLCREFEFTGAVLSKAIAATFRRRKTKVPDNVPIGLSKEFSFDRAKAIQWSAFIRRTSLKIVENDLTEVVTTIRDFLMPPSKAAASGVLFHEKWPKSGPWQN